MVLILPRSFKAGSSRKNNLLALLEKTNCDILSTNKFIECDHAHKMPLSAQNLGSVEEENE